MSATTNATDSLMTPMARVIRDIVRAAGVEDEYLTASEFCLRVPNGPWMDLVIESFPAGPKGSGEMYDNLEVGGRRHVSVGHYFVQNGDRIPDPELEMNELGYPFMLDHQHRYISYPIYRDQDSGVVMLRPQAKRAAMEFCNMWARNLRSQGFVKAAKALREAKATAQN